MTSADRIGEQPAASRAVTQWPSYDVERTSVRVVVVDGAGAILMFDTRDPAMPEIGRWWELPGGGMEPGESAAQTAVRELGEETGLVVAAEDVVPPTWTRSASYVRGFVRTWQHEQVVRITVVEVAPVPAADGRTQGELEAYVGHRWWTVDQIVAAGASGSDWFFPGRLPELLPRFLRGELIDEPFDLWN